MPTPVPFPCLFPFPQDIPPCSAGSTLQINMHSWPGIIWPPKPLFPGHLSQLVLPRHFPSTSQPPFSFQDLFHTIWPFSSLCPLLSKLSSPSRPNFPARTPLLPLPPSGAGPFSQPPPFSSWVPLPAWSLSPALCNFLSLHQPGFFLMAPSSARFLSLSSPPPIRPCFLVNASFPKKAPFPSRPLSQASVSPLDRQPGPAISPSNSHGPLYHPVCPSSQASCPNGQSFHQSIPPSSVSFPTQPPFQSYSRSLP